MCHLILCPDIYTLAGVILGVVMCGVFEAYNGDRLMIRCYTMPVLISAILATSFTSTYDIIVGTCLTMKFPILQ